jgi:hypothetical protein
LTTNPSHARPWRRITVTLLLVALAASFVARLGTAGTLPTMVALAVCGLAFAASLLAFCTALLRPAGDAAGPTPASPRRREGSSR